MTIAKVLSVFLLLPITFCSADSIVDNIKRDFTNYANAISSNNYDVVISYLHPRALASAGGRAKTIEALRAAQSQMRSNGMKIQDSKMIAMREHETIGNSLASLLHYHIILDTPNAIITIPSTVLCVSEDNGKNWRFADVGSFTASQYQNMFPEFARIIPLPPKMQPMVTNK